MEAMEAWPHADERVMQRSYNEQSASRVRGLHTGWMVTATPLCVAPCKRRSFSKGST